MALQASANVGAIKAASGLPTWLRGIGTRQVRLACGLVMFSYIFLHFFNHALGIISFDTMEAWLQWHLWWWRIPVVNGTLYTAAAIHLSLGLWALYQRRHFRYAAAEIAQLVLGFSIPLLLASHFGGERVAGWIYGRVPVSYAPPLFGYWVTRPYMVAVQFTLLTVAWTHALHRTVFLVAAEVVFQMGLAHVVRGRNPAAPTCDDRHVSWGARSHPTCQAAAMARPTYQSNPAAATRGHRSNNVVLLSNRLCCRDRIGVRGARGTYSSRTSPRHVHGVISTPSGTGA